MCRQICLPDVSPRATPTGHLLQGTQVRPASAFSDNRGLCGPPLSYFCPFQSSTSLIIGLVAACTASTGVVLACIIVRWQQFRPRNRDGAFLGDDDLWAKRIKAPKSITVFLFEKPEKELKLIDFMVATNYFDQDSFLYESLRGTFYVVGMRDGSMLEVQRLRRTKQDFQAEMDSLMGMRHKNLVPLLGYCVAGSEKLLVYKHMQRKSLWDNLHKIRSPRKTSWIGLPASGSVSELRAGWHGYITGATRASSIAISALEAYFLMRTMNQGYRISGLLAS